MTNLDAPQLKHLSIQDVDMTGLTALPQSIETLTLWGIPKHPSSNTSDPYLRELPNLRALQVGVNPASFMKSPDLISRLFLDDEVVRGKQAAPYLELLRIAAHSWQTKTDPALNNLEGRLKPLLDDRPLLRVVMHIQGEKPVFIDE